MALIKYGPIAQEVSGTIGGVTFARVQCGKDARGWRAPVNKRTPSQLEHRLLLTHYANAWFSVLNAASRQSWINYAPSCTFTNSLGEEYHIKGYNMFLRNSLIRHLGYGFNYRDAPTLPSFPSLPSLTWTLTHSTGVLALAACSPSPPNNTFITVLTNTLRRITQIFPWKRVIACSAIDVFDGLPQTFYTFPNPLPGAVGTLAALALWYWEDPYQRISNVQRTSVPSS